MSGHTSPVELATTLLAFVICLLVKSPGRSRRPGRGVTVGDRLCRGRSVGCSM
ncbi:MAG: hypothetical protein HY329_14150 [Chloroflexi bacterium]|nr:hypothetical protein [Chloroflexota bacterium]